MSVTAAYFMEDAREAARLEAKVDAADWVTRHLATTAVKARWLLEVGCGPAALVAAAARARPQDTVCGVDASEARLVVARQRIAGLVNANVLLGDASALPVPDGRFDVVWSRFLLEYLRDPLAAVKEMVHACRPGGEVLLQDLDGQLLWHHPIDPQLARWLGCVMERLAATGFDPFIGRKLHALARAAGLTDIRVSAETYHLVAGVGNERDLALWRMKLEIARPVIVDALGQADGQRAIDAFMEHLENPDTLTYSVQFTVRGKKPGGGAP